MNHLAMKSGDIFQNPPLTAVKPLLREIPEEVMAWLERFQREGWSGSVTFHFNRGQLSSYEPKPNLRTVAK